MNPQRKPSQAEVDLWVQGAREAASMGCATPTGWLLIALADNADRYRRAMEAVTDKLLPRFDGLKQPYVCPTYDRKCPYASTCAQCWREWALEQADKRANQ